MPACSATSSRRSPFTRSRVPAGRPRPDGDKHAGRPVRHARQGWDGRSQAAPALVARSAAPDDGRMTTVLITGANRGLGYETARQLADRGWTVLLGARDPERGRTAAEKLAADGGDVRHIPLDVTDDDSVAAAVERVTGITDRLDVLVNNAGIIGSTAAPLDTGPADFLACFGVNLLGPVRVTRAFLPLLARSELPRVVMVSSGMGSLANTPDPDRLESTFVTLVYPSSKATN